MTQQLPVVFAYNAALAVSSGSCRLGVTTTTKRDRYVIWLEAKASKHQWQCCVSDMTQHAPPNVVLPMHAVMAAFKRAVEAPSSRETLNMGTPDAADAKDGHLQLILHMSLMVELELDFTFDMAPLTVEAVEILAAKIRDVEDTIAVTNQKLSALEKRLNEASPTWAPFCGGDSKKAAEP
ncbi:hypothetical protein SDRG_14084 [Saprolegnia diclina VS20]|uniref:Uncharacterized protein n=1 Tax=Saprolegnia diclina (strain VS20) TaxID=1156394 RepID=T0PRK7_SAPDV|nr:hypothetical protein SDRG_14084 [Saprolegnia diclina VS20]EQC28124.1 hypothetical protein SDRG_14084 [Saprolegnia diclina VS20]|eukprot:XP_008618410.1 hypothetical protein SDRG_14084 [Saprolegnia diclina VS20]